MVEGKERASGEGVPLHGGIGRTNSLQGGIRVRLAIEADHDHHRAIVHQCRGEWEGVHL